MVRECENCGEAISDDFYRVYWPEGAPVLNCPSCPSASSANFQPKINDPGA